MKRTLVVSLVCMSIALASCGKERKLDSGITASEAFPSRFNEIRKRILGPRCASCHAAFVSHKALLEELVVPGNPSESKLFQEIDANEMPPYDNHLIDAEKDAIRQWIAKGAPND